MKWACLQPLSGGFYFGAELAFGKPAEWIISFPGLDLDDSKKCPNEFPVLSYLTKKQKCPPYWQFNGEMFSLNNIYPEFINSEFTPNNLQTQEAKDNLLSNPVDIIIGLPVCSGLSAANMAEQKKELASCSCKNNNMKYLTNFTLTRLKPKVYIFENAPALYSNKGFDIRKDLNKIAFENNYSVIYIKTDTKLHDNIQRRERTFVVFYQNNLDFSSINFTHNSPTSVINYLKDKINTNAEQNDLYVSPIKLQECWDYKFIINKYGTNWRSKVGNSSLLQHILDYNLDNEFYKFYNNDEKICHPVRHARNKISQNKGFFDRSHKNIPEDRVPVIFFKTVQDIIHPTEDRFYTVREIMTFMGMPQDYNWPWDNINKFSEKIGQNVPVLTARDICSEVKRLLENSSTQLPQNSIYFYNNIDPQKSYFEDKISSI